MFHMGKRKRRVDRNKTPPSPAIMSHSSQMESSLKENASHSFGVTGAKATSSSLTNIMERSLPTQNQSSGHHHHHNVNRALLSRFPRHNYDIQHSQRNAAIHSGTSTSHGLTTFRDEKILKFAHRHESGFGGGRRDKTSWKLGRIRSNHFISNENSPKIMNMICRLCQQRTGDDSVVAVLVCGHVYHADCLEIKTCNEDRRDPSCPLCM